jgi:hypothetical protein
MAIKLSRAAAADVIERFLSGQTDEYEWDDFTSCRYSDAAVDEAARRSCAVRDEHPPPPGSHAYCSESGLAALRQVALRLRKSTER